MYKSIIVRSATPRKGLEYNIQREQIVKNRRFLFFSSFFFFYVDDRSELAHVNDAKTNRSELHIIIIIVVVTKHNSNTVCVGGSIGHHHQSPRPRPIFRGLNYRQIQLDIWEIDFVFFFFCSHRVYILTHIREHTCQGHIILRRRKQIACRFHFYANRCQKQKRNVHYYNTYLTYIG